MKKYIVILMSALCLMTIAGCENESSEWGNAKDDVVGEWHLITWNGEAVRDFDIYMKLGSNGRFEIYQQFSTPYYELYKGLYNAQGGVLSGKYSDDVLWNDTYDYALSNGGQVLTLTSRSDSHIQSVYARERVPENLIVGEPSRAASAGRRAL
ncbi:MAG: hypothetical protein J1E33_00255 [Alistipes sp.]|nr:hypothetical protein [Alistipes sp.]